MPLTRKRYPSDDRAYKSAKQRHYRSQPNTLCECGRPKTLKVGNRFLCPHCSPLESQDAMFQFHKPTCGSPGGFTEFALWLPQQTS